MVYGGVRWCMVVYGGVRWCMVVYGGVGGARFMVVCLWLLLKLSLVRRPSIDLQVEDTCISFVIDDQLVVRNIVSPGSFIVRPPLMVGDAFYKLDGVFLKRNDDPLKVLISDPCPTSYSAQMLRQYISHDHQMTRGMVTMVIKKIHAFVPDSTWLREISSDSSSTRLSPPGMSLYGGVWWCTVVYGGV